MPNKAQLGFLVISRMSTEKYSRMVTGFLSMELILLKEKQHLRKGQMIMATHLVPISTDTINVVVIIFTLTVLNPKTPIPEEMADMEYLVGAIVIVAE